MSFQEEYALTILKKAAKTDAFKALSREEQLDFTEGVMERVEAGKQPVSPETSDTLQKLEGVQVDRIERLKKSTPRLRQDATDEEKQRHFDNYIGTPSDLKDARRNANYEALGVVTDKPLPSGDWRLGFGIEPLQDVKNVLKEHYQTDVDVFKSEDDMFFIDPETNKPTKVNTTAVASAGLALPLAGDVTGTVATLHPSVRTASVPGMVAKETVGSGLGAGFGEATRLLVGRALGVHDASWEDTAKRIGKVGGEAALWTGGVGSTMAAGKGIWNFYMGGLYTLDEAAKFGFKGKKGEEVVSAMNKIIKEGGGEKQFKATQAQKADDVKLASAEREARSSIEHGQRFKDFDVAQQEASGEALEVLSKEPMTVAQTTGDIGEVVRAKTGRRARQAEEIVTKNIEELDTQLKQLSKTPKETVGEPTVKFIEQQAEKANVMQKESWKNVENVGGFNAETGRYGIEIPTGKEAKKLKGQFKARSKEAETVVEAGGISKIYTPDPKGKQPPKPVQDLANANHEISTLKSEYRSAMGNPRSNASHNRELLKVVKAKEADRTTALMKAGRKDIVDAIEKAELDTLLYNETYVRSVAGDLIEKTERGIPVIKSQQFVDDMLGRNVEEVEHFKNVIAGNPELLAKWQEGIADAWKSKAFNEKGAFNAQASKRWFDVNEDALKQFFTDQEVKSFKGTGDFAKKLLYGRKLASGQFKPGQVKRLETMKKKINDKFGSGALSKVDPENMVKFITKEGGSWATPAGRGVQARISKIQAVRNITKEYPAAWDRVKNDFKRHIKNDILDNKTGNIKPEAIARWVKDSENARVVEEVLGSKYLRDLDTVNKAIQMIHKSETRLVKSQAEKAAIQVVRAGAAPPLTKRGRALTAALTFKNKEAQRRMVNSLLDDHTLREVAELLTHKPGTRQFAEKAFSLGFALPDENE